MPTGENKDIEQLAYAVIPLSSMVRFSAIFAYNYRLLLRQCQKFLICFLSTSDWCFTWMTTKSMFCLGFNLISSVIKCKQQNRGFPVIFFNCFRQRTFKEKDNRHFPFHTVPCLSEYFFSFIVLWTFLVFPHWVLFFCTTIHTQSYNSVFFL